MEGVGQLAGGIAHNFNNLLTVILGHSEFALEALSKDDPNRAGIEGIRDAGKSAAALTQQLLAFSRRQLIRPEVVDLNALVAQSKKLFGRLIGEDIDVDVVLSGVESTVFADPAQIEQVLMNLIVNGRDAMPAGGTLTIAVENVEVTQVPGQTQFELAPGSYALLSISDTGMGMDKSTMGKIFEPFFTTKPLGKGTGLGLATVYGIVKQSGGHIAVESDLGKGTTFRVCLPRTDRVSETAVSETVAMRTTAGETILLVEDDDGVRGLTQRILTAAGYKVLLAATGSEALEVIKREDTPVHLVLTDVIMPCMSGRELVERITKIRPEIKSLYMTGYMPDTLLNKGALDETVHLITKPFTHAALTGMVRRVLDS